MVELAHLKNSAPVLELRSTSGAPLPVNGPDEENVQLLDAKGAALTTVAASNIIPTATALNNRLRMVTTLQKLAEPRENHAERAVGKPREVLYARPYNKS